MMIVVKIIHTVAICVCVREYLKFAILANFQCLIPVDVLSRSPCGTAKYLRELWVGVPWGVGTMASWDCNLKRCWVSMGESKEK